jgi:hypothetical protein
VQVVAAVTDHQLNAGAGPSDVLRYMRTDRYVPHRVGGPYSWRLCLVSAVLLNAPFAQPNQHRAIPERPTGGVRGPGHGPECPPHN